jgi:hypothetical protein
LNGGSPRARLGADVRQFVGRAIGKISLSHAVTAGAAVVITVVAAYVIWGTQSAIVRTKLLPPDTPPAEYLYLDQQRVLAYLGQIEGGLTAQEKRTSSETKSVTAGVKGGLLADIGGSASTSASVEQVVSPTATDRFFSLLIKLRSGRERVGGRNSPWLKTLNLRVGHKNSTDAIRRALAAVQIGDFVRLNHAHLFLPSYAALAPKVRYAVRSATSASSATPPRVTPSSLAQQRSTDAYLRGLGPNPTLPFVAHTLDASGADRHAGTFFVPAAYQGLLDNERLLAGDLTVVGKVIYEDMRPRPKEPCPSQDRPALPPCTYFDRETLATFAPALEKAPKPVLERLDLASPTRARGAVQRSVTFGTPVVVVLPVAIYQ